MFASPTALPAGVMQDRYLNTLGGNMHTREISETLTDEFILELHECIEIRMMWEIGRPELKRTDGIVLWKPDIGIETEFRTTSTQLDLIGHFSDPETGDLYIPRIQIRYADLCLRWAPIPWQPKDDRWDRPEKDFSQWISLDEAENLSTILLSSGMHVAAFHNAE